MLLLDCLAQQTVKPEKPAVDGQLDWYVDWLLITWHGGLLIFMMWWRILYLWLNHYRLKVCGYFDIKTYFSCLSFALECGNSKVDRRPLFIKKSSHTQPHTLRALFLPSLSVCSSWNLPPQTPTSPPLLNFFFFFLGGTLRKNVIQHIQASAPKSLLQTCSHWFSQRINCSK